MPIDIILPLRRLWLLWLHNGRGTWTSSCTVGAEYGQKGGYNGGNITVDRECFPVTQALARSSFPGIKRWREEVEGTQVIDREIFPLSLDLTP